MATITTAGLPSGTFSIGDQLVGNQSGATKRLTIETSGLADVEGVSDWVPTLFGGTTAGVTTYSQQIGKYYKIGNLVTLVFYLAWSDATGTGPAGIGDLPFMAASYTGIFRFGLSVAYYDGLALPSATLHGYIQDGTDFISLRGTSATSMNNPLDLQSELTTSGEIQGSITYLV